MQFHFHANQSHFHKNGFALGLVLKQRHKGTRKWPIWSVTMLLINKSDSRWAVGGRPILSLVFELHSVVLRLITTANYPFSPFSYLSKYTALILVNLAFNLKLQGRI